MHIKFLLYIKNELSFNFSVHFPYACTCTCSLLIIIFCYFYSTSGIQSKGNQKWSRTGYAKAAAPVIVDTISNR